MNNVRSRPIGGPPLDRALLDSAASPVRMLFGALFLGWSWISTIIIVGHFLSPVLPGARLEVVGDSYALAFGVAFLVSLAEFVSARRWPGAYWTVLLLLDASFTTVQTHTWLALIVQAQTPQIPISTGLDIVLWLVSIAGGVVAAIFGELLLFGPRR